MGRGELISKFPNRVGGMLFSIQSEMLRDVIKRFPTFLVLGEELLDNREGANDECF
jgi:hypothetical protein